MQTTVLFVFVIICSSLAQAALSLGELKMLELYTNVKRLDRIMPVGDFFWTQTKSNSETAGMQFQCNFKMSSVI